MVKTFNICASTSFENWVSVVAMAVLQMACSRWKLPHALAYHKQHYNLSFIRTTSGLLFISMACPPIDSFDKKDYVKAGWEGIAGMRTTCIALLLHKVPVKIKKMFGNCFNNLIFYNCVWCINNSFLPLLMLGRAVYFSITKYIFYSQ